MTARASCTSVAMALLVAFIVVHVAMVALVPRSLLTMIRGR